MRWLPPLLAAAPQAMGLRGVGRLKLIYEIASAC